MAKKSAIFGEYIVTVEDSGSIRVCQIYDRVLDSLRECAKEVGFKYSPTLNTYQLGKKLVEEYGDGKMAEIGEYTISVDGSDNVDSYRVFGNTIAILKKLASETGMKIEHNMNTRTIGSKLVDHINGVAGEELTEEGFIISPDMTTVELYEEFTKEFGTHLRIKKGVKRCDPNKREPSPAELSLSEVGLTETVKINEDMTVSEVEALLDEKGLKVQVATVDDWTTALPETPLDSVRFMPKNTTKDKMREIMSR